MTGRSVWFCALLLVASTSHAQTTPKVDDFPDLPMTESAPKEAPFTQPNDEFEEADKASKVPVEKSDPLVKEVESADANNPAPPPAPDAEKHPPKKAKKVSRGVELIEHPMASKGLIRIESDGSYIYKTAVSKHDQSSTFRVGSIQPPNIDSADGKTNFKTMYSRSDIPIFMYDYEWQPFSQFGKLGVQAGFGFFTAQGNGRFLDGTEAREKYTFFAIPLNVGVVYRMELSDRQWLAPYVAGGLSYYAIGEFRDDSKAPHGVGTPGAYGAGGLMFNVSSFDRETAYTLDSEYGITNLWLSFEFRYVKSFSADIDLTASIINLGIAVDY